MQGTSAPDYVGIGFDKIDRDLRFLIECLGEVLTDLGLGELATHLPWFGKVATDEEIERLPPQLGLV